MSVAAASDFEVAPAPTRSLLTPLILAAGGVALADWLFYGWQIGISLALFLSACSDKSNSWLLATNAVSLALVLYGCCLVNAPRLVATYNIEHCREVGGTGPNLDFKYLASLGPEAKADPGAVD
jgi:Domain of unknown function (DUF4173)